MTTSDELNDCHEYTIRCNLPLEFFLTVEGRPGLSNEDVMRLVSTEDFDLAVESIIGGQTDSDLRQRCLDAWECPACAKIVF
jgi:hypothetical protein